MITILGLGAGRSEAATETAPAEAKRDTIAANGVVAAAHPLAARAGVEVLRKGATPLMRRLRQP